MNVFYSAISIFPTGEAGEHKTRGIWDTGASNTVITQNVVDALGLKSTGITLTNTVSERNKKSETYIIDIKLKDDLTIFGIKVTVGTILDTIDCLIGMDIINRGDFSITNFNGKSCMSFRIPSLHEIDYCKAISKNHPIKAGVKTGRNDPCPCGSDLKYKNCHGK